MKSPKRKTLDERLWMKTRKETKNLKRIKARKETKVPENAGNGSSQTPKTEESVRPVLIKTDEAREEEI